MTEYLTENKGTPLHECTIISLKPKNKLLKELKEISYDLLDIDEKKIKKILNPNLLESHTIPVCIPLLTNPKDFYSFIKKNSKILFDLMLTAWPFPIDQWGFTNKNIALVTKYVDIKYFPIVCKAIIKPVNTTLDLAVTFATPTQCLIDYILESISSKKMNLSEEEMTELEIIISTGVAIVTNNIEQSDYQNSKEYFEAINDSKNYLSSLKENIVKTLFYFYFDHDENYPEEISNDYLSKWFNTKTYLGLYMLTDPSIASEYNSEFR